MPCGPGHLEGPAGDTGLSALTPLLAEGRWRCACRDPGWKGPRWRRKFKPLDTRGDQPLLNKMSQRFEASAKHLCQRPPGRAARWGWADAHSVNQRLCAGFLLKHTHSFYRTSLVFLSRQSLSLVLVSTENKDRRQLLDTSVLPGCSRGPRAARGAAPLGSRPAASTVPPSPAHPPSEKRLLPQRRPRPLPRGPHPPPPPGPRSFALLSGLSLLSHFSARPQPRRRRTHRPCSQDVHGTRRSSKDETPAKHAALRTRLHDRLSPPLPGSPGGGAPVPDAPRLPRPLGGLWSEGAASAHAVRPATSWSPLLAASPPQGSSPSHSHPATGRSHGQRHRTRRRDPPVLSGRQRHLKGFSS